ELEQICDHIVAVEGGKLLRADTITSFTQVSQVLAIEVEEGMGQLMEELTRRGLRPVPQDRALLVRLTGENTYDEIRDAVADLGLPLTRMEQRRHRIEELFRESAVGVPGPDGAGIGQGAGQGAGPGLPGGSAYPGGTAPPSGAAHPSDTTGAADAR
ncbi:MAG: ABC transporter ATP-binding protein, partial [Actinomycetota bacterium]